MSWTDGVVSTPDDDDYDGGAYGSDYGAGYGGPDMSADAYGYPGGGYGYDDGTYGGAAPAPDAGPPAWTQGQPISGPVDIPGYADLLTPALAQAQAQLQDAAYAPASVYPLAPANPEDLPRLDPNNPPPNLFGPIPDLPRLPGYDPTTDDADPMSVVPPMGLPLPGELSAGELSPPQTLDLTDPAQGLPSQADIQPPAAADADADDEDDTDDSSDDAEGGEGSDDDDDGDTNGDEDDDDGGDASPPTDAPPADNAGPTPEDGVLGDGVYSSDTPPSLIRTAQPISQFDWGAEHGLPGFPSPPSIGSGAPPPSGYPFGMPPASAPPPDPSSNMPEGTLNRRMQYAYEFFRNQGWEPMQARAIVGNLLGEDDQLDPYMPQKPRRPGGKPGPAYGIAQWEPPRQKDFENWSGHKLKDSVFDEQLQFVQHELNSTRSAAGKALRGAKTIPKAMDILVRQYEQSHNQDSDIAKRIPKALGLHLVEPDVRTSNQANI